MYELVIVSKISESDGLLQRVEKALKDAEATELKVEKLGKKQLAYPIKKQTEADYTMLNFEVAGSAIADLSSMLRLEQEALLRHMLIKQKIRKVPRRKLRAKKVEEVVKVVEAPKVTVVTKTVAGGQADKKRQSDKGTEDIKDIKERKKVSTVSKRTMSDKIKKEVKSPKAKRAVKAKK